MPELLSGRDVATSKERMSLLDLGTLISETNTQPAWRREAQTDASYYDNHQWTPAEIAEMGNRGQPTITKNIIKTAVDKMVGLEVKSRSDWTVRADGSSPADNDMAEAISEEMKKAERLSKADRACSHGYRGQLKCGIGWAEVIRNPDPFGFSITCNPVHRDEIWWDWRAQDLMLDDARYLIRKRWVDEDVAIEFLPAHKEIIKASINGWETFDFEIASSNETTIDAIGSRLTSNINDSEWLDASRKRIAIYEVWYRKWERGLLMRLQDGRVMAFDKKNPGHRSLVVQGMGRLEESVFPATRLAFWIGPHRVEDVATPYNHNWFPYVPFWGFRDDRTKVPYGYIRVMRSQQDEVNARRAKMMWLLSSRRVILDSDAVDNHDDVREEIARPDAYIQLNPHRVNKDGFKYETDVELADRQFQILAHAERSVLETAGIDQLAAPEKRVESGAAMNTVMENGSLNMGEINDNFREARTRMGELILPLLIESMAGRETTVKVNREVGRPKKIILNRPVYDEAGEMSGLNNDISQLRARVVLEDVPSSPTYRSQQFTYIMEISKSLPPDSLQLLLPDLIMFSDMPNKKQVAMSLKKQYGQALDPEELSPEEKQQVEADKKAKAEADALLRRGEQIKIAQREAEAKKVTLEGMLVAAEAAAAVADDPVAAMMADDIMEGAKAMVDAGGTAPVEEDMGSMPEEMADQLGG